MAQKTVYNFAYLEVDLDEPWGKEISRARWLTRAKNVADQIKRHCDNVDSITIKHDISNTCEFCGYRWTPQGIPNYNGGCCDEDQQNDPTQEETS